MDPEPTILNFVQEREGDLRQFTRDLVAAPSPTPPAAGGPRAESISIGNTPIKNNRKAPRRAGRIWLMGIRQLAVWGAAILLCTHPLAATEPTTLKSDFVEAVFSGSGMVKQIRGQPRMPRLLAAPIRLRLYEEASKLELADEKVPADRMAKAGQAFTVDKTYQPAKLAWHSEFQIGRELTWTVTLKNLSQDRRAVTLEFAVRLAGSDFQAVFPSLDDRPQWEEGQTLCYAHLEHLGERWIDGKQYHYDPITLSIPSATFYSAGRDVGLTICAGLDGPKVYFPIEFLATRRKAVTDVIIVRPYLRLESGGSRTVTMHLVPHPGDWRCGFAWMRDQWPEYFWVPKGLEKYQNMQFGGAAWGPFEMLEKTERFKQDYWLTNPWRTGSSELIGYTRFFGQWFSSSNAWKAGVETKWMLYKQSKDTDLLPTNAPWQDIVRYVEGGKLNPAVVEANKDRSERWRSDALLTHELMREFIRFAHQHCDYSFYYLNPTEVWKPWGQAVIPDSLFGTARDRYTAAWSEGDGSGLDCWFANPFPGGSWEKQLLDQAKSLFDAYPNLSGLFIDQCASGGRDEAGYDDGITISPDLKPGNQMRWNVAGVVAKLRDLAHARGKYIWTNQSGFEVIRHADLTLVESTYPEMFDYIRYMLVGNRACINIQPFEHLYQSAAINGIYSELPCPPDHPLDGVKPYSFYAVTRRYYPVYDLFRGREWVLEPHCLELDGGRVGNLFCRPDRNYVASVLSPGTSSGSDWFSFDVPVRFRIDDAGDVRAAYVISADRLGSQKVPFSRNGKDVEVVIPRHRALSMVLLAKAGRFLSLADSATIGAGQATSVKLALDNFTDEKWAWRGAMMSVEGSELDVEVEPGATKLLDVAVSVPTEATDLFRFRLLQHAPGIIPAPDGAPEHLSTFEMYVESPVAIHITPPYALVERYLSNSRTLQNEQRVGPLTIAPLSLQEGETVPLEVTICNNGPAAAKLTLTVEGQNLSTDVSNETLDVPGGQSGKLRITVKAGRRGVATLTVTAKAQDRTYSNSVDYRIVGLKLVEGDLLRIKSADVVLDHRGTGEGHAIQLNGTDACKLVSTERNFWTNRERIAIIATALKGLGTSNEVHLIASPGSTLSVRRLFLEITLSDGPVVELHADPSPQSTPADWLQGVGERVEAGKPMQWRVGA